MLLKIFKILICFLLLTSFFTGLCGCFVNAACSSGLCIFATIGLYYLIKNLIKVLYKGYKKIVQFKKKHPERFKWVLFGVYSILLMLPVLRDIISIISLEGICNHIYLSILGVILIVYVIWFAYKNINEKLNDYKKANNIFLFESEDDELTFSDYIWSSCDVNKESLHWLRAFTTVFCYPFFFISYVICLSNQWNKIFQVVSFASLFIALYSIWYTVNLKKNQKSQGENPKAGELANFSPTPEEASRDENIKWKPLF